ncbi:hypothetical protein SpAn4DRAFT_2524 [Sporomusa ovata]|uniref:Uncharacterized protein n=1 Tax=Sporomusa ovata TaxID=2378 RepID=A0A0U1L0V1_9FIRM|nr:hypothetical protein SpAn4DRAFT_2524 [Sporomusa ovata]
MKVSSYNIECEIDIDANILIQAYTELKLNTRLENINEA